MSRGAADQQGAGEPLGQLGEVVSLIEVLSRRVIRAEVQEELLSDALRTLFQTVRYDIAVVLLVEQMLEMHTVARENAARLVNEDLLGDIREQLQVIVPGAFTASTEVISRLEMADLPAREGVMGQPRFHSAAVLEQSGHPLGVVVLYRDDAEFSVGEENVLNIFAMMTGLLLGSLRARRELSALADTDDLTGLRNRRVLRQQLQREIDRARVYSLPLSVLMLDIDDFKQINDTFGHLIGDVVLSEMSGVLQAITRQPDLVVRYGGDEFTVVLTHTDLGGAIHAAERIIDRANAISIEHDDAQIRWSVSIGIVTFDPETHETADDLIRIADSKLYEAKRAGKNRYVR